VFESFISGCKIWLQTLLVVALSFAAQHPVAGVDRHSASGIHQLKMPLEPAGEYGGNLEVLKGSYTPPGTEGESNHYIDLWEPGAVANFTRVHGLTNNRALFIDSHGDERFSWRGSKYVLRPRTRAAERSDALSFSIRDVYHVVGHDAAGQIHTVFVAGCNLGGRVRSAEIRSYFPRATNVTYMASGKLAYKQQLYQSLTQHSGDILPLHGRIVEDGEVVKASISREPVVGSTPLGTYVAELFAPGAKKPFRTQTAGRELLDPSFRFSPALRADNKSPFATNPNP
jgi:hypothetical protein